MGRIVCLGGSPWCTLLLSPPTHNPVVVGSSPTRPTTITPVKGDRPDFAKMLFVGLANEFANDSELSTGANQRIRTPVEGCSVKIRAKQVHECFRA